LNIGLDVKQNQEEINLEQAMNTPMSSNQVVEAPEVKVASIPSKKTSNSKPFVKKLSTANKSRVPVNLNSRKTETNVEKRIGV